MSFSHFQWMAPELCRGGFLAQNDWVVRHTSEASSMYGNDALKLAAVLIASVHFYGLELLQQAPAIAVAAGRGKALRSKRARLQVATLIGGYLERKTSLREIMRRLELPYQLRALSGKNLAPSHWPVMMALHDTHPSALAQAIPDRSGRQAAWLRALAAWRDQMSYRFDDPGRRFEWAGQAIGKALLTSNRMRTIERQVISVSDFIGQNEFLFDRRWTWAQAVAATTRWHEQLAELEYSESDAAACGVAYDDVIPYGKVATEFECGPYRMFALQTPRAIISEGANMRHCLRSYIPDVVSGRSWVFSITREGNRVATLELGVCGHRSPTGSTQRLEVRQMAGPCTHLVPKPVRDAATVFVEDLNSRNAAHSTHEGSKST